MHEPLNCDDPLKPPVSVGGEGDEVPQGVPYGQTPVPPTNASAPHPIARVQTRRDVFWQNVCREILMGLAAAAAQSAGRTGIGPSDAQMSPDPVSDLFDGRMAVITAQGQRIPIADVYPVFAFSMTGDEAARIRSGDVQCTVFRITTPTGENYTLPIGQIVGIHTLSQSLIEQLEEAEQPEEENGPRLPFGFAAYTSLARSEQLDREKKPQTESQTDPPTTPRSEPDTASEP